MDRIAQSIKNRLSLRPPQTDTRLGRTSVTMSGLKVDACRGCIDLKMQSLQSMVNWNTVR